MIYLFPKCFQRLAVYETKKSHGPSFVVSTVYVISFFDLPLLGIIIRDEDTLVPHL
jgi:hypothetical protein